MHLFCNHQSCHQLYCSSLLKQPCSILRTSVKAFRRSEKKQLGLLNTFTEFVCNLKFFFARYLCNIHSSRARKLNLKTISRLCSCKYQTYQQATNLRMSFKKLCMFPFKWNKNSCLFPQIVLQHRATSHLNCFLCSSASLLHLLLERLSWTLQWRNNVARSLHIEIKCVENCNLASAP